MSPAHQIGSEGCHSTGIMQLHMPPNSSAHRSFVIMTLYDFIGIKVPAAPISLSIGSIQHMLPNTPSLVEANSHLFDDCKLGAGCSTKHLRDNKCAFPFPAPKASGEIACPLPWPAKAPVALTRKAPPPLWARKIARVLLVGA